MWSLAATAACNGDHAAGPSTPACSSALASQVVLAVGAYTAIDPASGGGCVTIAANASTLDSAEYLTVPQSAAGTFGLSSPFELRTASLAAVAMPAAQLVEPVSSPVAVAVQFDGMLRRIGRVRAAGAGAAARSHPMTGPAPAALAPQPAGAPALGSLRKFAVCSALDCSHFKSASAKCVTSGYLAGFFFPPDLDTTAPIDSSNHGEIFYSIVADPNMRRSAAPTAGRA